MSSTNSGAASRTDAGTESRSRSRSPARTPAATPAPKRAPRGAAAAAAPGVFRQRFPGMPRLSIATYPGNPSEMLDYLRQTGFLRVMCLREVLNSDGHPDWKLGEVAVKIDHWDQMDRRLEIIADIRRGHSGREPNPADHDYTQYQAAMNEWQMSGLMEYYVES